MDLRDVLRAVGERMDGLLEARPRESAPEGVGPGSDGHGPRDERAGRRRAAEGAAAAADGGIATELISIEAPAYGIAAISRRPPGPAEHRFELEAEAPYAVGGAPEDVPPAPAEPDAELVEPRTPVRDTAQASRARRADDGLGRLRNRLVQRRAESTAQPRRRIGPRRSQVVNVLRQVSTGLVLVAVSAAISILLV